MSCNGEESWTPKLNAVKRCYRNDLFGLLLHWGTVWFGLGWHTGAAILAEEIGVQKKHQHKILPLNETKLDFLAVSSFPIIAFLWKCCYYWCKFCWWVSRRTQHPPPNYDESWPQWAKCDEIWLKFRLCLFFTIFFMTVLQFEISSTLSHYPPSLAHPFYYCFFCLQDVTRVFFCPEPSPYTNWLLHCNCRSAPSFISWGVLFEAIRMIYNVFGALLEAFFFSLDNFDLPLCCWRVGKQGNRIKFNCWILICLLGWGRAAVAAEKTRELCWDFSVGSTRIQYPFRNRLRDCVHRNWMVIGYDFFCVLLSLWVIRQWILFYACQCKLSIQF